MAENIDQSKRRRDDEAAPESATNSTPGGSPPGQSAAASPGPAGRSSAAATARPAAGSKNVVASRHEEFLIAARPPALMPLTVAGVTAGLPPTLGTLVGNQLAEDLKQDKNIELVRTLRLEGVFGTLATSTLGPQEIHVARADPAYAEAFQQSRPDVIVERNAHLRHFGLPAQLPGVVASSGVMLTITVEVVGKNSTPLPAAQVSLYGNQSSAQGVTDDRGQVTLTLQGETPDSLYGMIVTPQADYWNLWIRSPRLTPNQVNSVTLTSLDQTFPGFPNKGITTWGLHAMQVDQLPPTLQGQGIKVAVVDTGIAANTHADLRGQVRDGYDIVNQRADTWSQDEEGHGTHCAGIIAGRADGAGVRGIAPGVELHAYKIFPGGRFSDLIDALNRCIQDQVDVVNLSLGTDTGSVLVENKLLQVKQAGIACIVAAGNSAGPVQYPASSPNVLAVAAIGRRNTFPAQSWHNTEAVVGNGLGISAEGYFSPVFTCYGPQIAVCAPGVAVISCWPPNSYASLDGTSMAAPHVTGLAALILAHHPDFQGAYRPRNAPRVERLFQILRQGTHPLLLGEPVQTRLRTGSGLADAVATLGAGLGASAFPGGTTIPPSGVWAQSVGTGAMGRAGSGGGQTPAAVLSARVAGSAMPTHAAVPPPGPSASAASLDAQGWQTVVHAVVNTTVPVVMSLLQGAPPPYQAEYAAGHPLQDGVTIP